MKSSIALILVLTSMSAFAYSSQSTLLIPGKEVLIDSANKDVISLTLDTNSKNSKAEPKVSIVKEWGNFTCDYKQTLLLNSAYDQSKKIYKYTWEIQVTWTPGADLSGCIVNVSFPGQADSRASIYMNY